MYVAQWYTEPLGEAVIAMLYREQGRLKITRGPWATALRQAPLPQKTFFLFYLFEASWQLFIFRFFFLVNMPVNIHNTVLRKMWI